VPHAHTKCLNRGHINRELYHDHAARDFGPFMDSKSYLSDTYLTTDRDERPVGKETIYDTSLFYLLACFLRAI